MGHRAHRDTDLKQQSVVVSGWTQPETKFLSFSQSRNYLVGQPELGVVPALSKGQWAACTPQATCLEAAWHPCSMTA